MAFVAYNRSHHGGRTSRYGVTVRCRDGMGHISKHLRETHGLDKRVTIAWDRDSSCMAIRAAANGELSLVVTSTGRVSLRGFLSAFGLTDVAVCGPAKWDDEHGLIVPLGPKQSD